jgi:hypothetical protein
MAAVPADMMDRPRRYCLHALAYEDGCTSWERGVRQQEMD